MRPQSPRRLRRRHLDRLADFRKTDQNDADYEYEEQEDDDVRTYWQRLLDEKYRKFEKRVAAAPDFGGWRHRLRIFGLDMRDLGAIEKQLVKIETTAEKDGSGGEIEKRRRGSFEIWYLGYCLQYGVPPETWALRGGLPELEPERGPQSAVAA